MHKGIIAYVVVIAVLIIAWWVFASFANPLSPHGTTTIENGSAAQQGGGYDCVGAYLATQKANAVVAETCTWGGGSIGLWVASGNNAYAGVSIKAEGKDGKLYVNKTFSNPCLSQYDVYQLPKQNYTVTLTTGPLLGLQSGRACSSAIVQLSTPSQNSSSPNTNIVNGNFSTGTYYGWVTDGLAWGVVPLNVTKANAQGCYPEAQKWSGYSGNFFASTYQCGYGSHALGNLTSLPFMTSMSFLNFQVLGSGGAASYIEILYNNTVYIRARFSTVNMTNTRQGLFTFYNATLPLYSARNKLIQVRVVANETVPTDFLAVGNFRLGSRPIQTKSGILVNITLSSG